MLLLAYRVTWGFLALMVLMVLMASEADQGPLDVQ
jgi:hypothetical protein